MPYEMCNLLSGWGLCHAERRNFYSLVGRRSGSCRGQHRGDSLMIRVGVITASDKGSRGEREDLSGPTLIKLVQDIGGEVVEYVVLPDEQTLLAEKMRQWADELCLDLILTTGGTGFSRRDVMPEATLSVADRLVPG